ncbi:unnamed protein product, partial [Didymodactylos carnosus]
HTNEKNEFIQKLNDLFQISSEQLTLTNLFLKIYELFIQHQQLGNIDDTFRKLNEYNYLITNYGEQSFETLLKNLNTIISNQQKLDYCLSRWNENFGMNEENLTIDTLETNLFTKFNTQNLILSRSNQFLQDCSNLFRESDLTFDNLFSKLNQIMYHQQKIDSLLRSYNCNNIDTLEQYLIQLEQQQQQYLVQQLNDSQERQTQNDQFFSQCQQLFTSDYSLQSEDILGKIQELKNQEKNKSEFMEKCKILFDQTSETVTSYDMILNQIETLKQMNDMSKEREQVLIKFLDECQHKMGEVENNVDLMKNIQHLIDFKQKLETITGHIADDSYIEILKSTNDQLSSFGVSKVDDLCLRLQQSEYSCQQMLNDNQKIMNYVYEQCPHIPIESRIDPLRTVECVTQLYVQQSEDIRQMIL